MPTKLLAVAASGQNLDRLVSCFRAAKRSGRQLVIDPYQAYVLTKLASLSPNVPQFTWEAVRVSFLHNQVQRLIEAGEIDLVREMKAEGKITSDELAAEPGHFLISTRGTYRVTRLFEKVGVDRVVLVWSMWRGYWERNGRLRTWSERNGIVPQFIHSGGHAWPEDLRRLVAAVGAKKTIWVHTDSDVPEREPFMNSEASQQP